jgi:hypothetical protein
MSALYCLITVCQHCCRVYTVQGREVCQPYTVQKQEIRQLSCIIGSTTDLLSKDRKSVNLVTRRRSVEMERCE